MARMSCSRVGVLPGSLTQLKKETLSLAFSGHKALSVGILSKVSFGNIQILMSAAQAIGTFRKLEGRSNVLTSSLMQVWVLTGDKIETAISIALACQLFSPTTKLLMLRERDLGCSDSQLTSEVLKLKVTEVQQLLRSASHPSSRSVL